jgi:cytochrome c-type biogenesis protein
MTGQLGMAAAFGAGLLSFLSPCVLPLIPAYLSLMTGLTASELSDSEMPKARILVPALLFVLGFSIVFVALGASASVLGQFLMQYRVVVERIAGVLVIAFGVLMLGVIRVPWLYGEARVDVGRARSFGRGASLVMGMAFAAGWTPCVGPILGSILALAGSSGNVATGSMLLLAYSLGLGVPFVAVAVLFSRMMPVVRWVARRSLVINRVAGSVLIVVGALIFTGRLGVLAAWFTRVLPTLPQ